MNGRIVVFILMAMLMATATFGQITVVSSTPVNGAVDVPLTSTISFTFSEALDTSRHLGDDGMCVYFLSHDPQDSAQLVSLHFSGDLRTMYFDVIHTANTDFVMLITAAFGQTGDTLTMPYPLCYTTAASHGARTVNGTVTYNGGPPPSGAIVGLLSSSPFGEGHGAVLAGTVISDVNGAYTVPYVRPGTYWPITARDMNHDGNMDGQVDLIGFYDPDHTGEPHSVSVAGADLGNVNMALTHLNDWVTARAHLDSVQSLMASYGSDYHLVMVQSNSDTIGLDGTSRSWRYGFYSQERQRGMSVEVEGHTYIVDTTAEHNQFPSNILNMPQNFLDSDTIMAIVESHGGAQVRQQHNVAQRMLEGGNIMWMAPGHPDVMMWLAMYSWQVDTTWQSWFLAMDLQTGQLLDLGTTPAGPEAGLADHYQLLANFPNPFNPVTTIPFVLPRAGQVELKVFDVLGRNVATLVNGNLNAGIHAVQFDATNLTNGIYFCRMTAGDHVQMRKMVLLK